MKKSVHIAMLVSAVLVLLPARGTAQNSSPFGVSMHIQGGEEHNQIPANLRMVRDAGIRWIRTDFSWGSVEGPQGTWHFDHLDRVVEETGKLGIGLLPLLSFDVPWARPAYKHLDAWLEYVEKTVTRYKDKVRCWEVWNEPNLYPRFWDQYDDADNYVLLLKATYQKIKEIDPGITVVFAGTAGIPMRYIEKAFAAGGGAFFDKMAIHPYRPFLDSWKATLAYKESIDNLRALMTKYKIGHKDIWYTEMGISSMIGVATRGRDVFHETRKETGKDWKVAVVCDDDYPVCPSFTAQTLRSFFPAGFRLDTVQILDTKHIRASEYDAVFFPPALNTPPHFSQALLSYLTDYMRGGGKVYCYTGDNLFYYGNATVKEANQAVFLAQTVLLALRFGIERYVWYELESPERNVFDSEDNFGLTRRGLSPKPAYHAYSTIGRLFPEDSKIDASVEWRQKDCCTVSWRQPDGTRVWALWAPDGSRKVNVKIGKGLRQAVDCTGKNLPAVTESSKTLEAGSGVIYLVGPETFEIQK